MSRSLEMSIPVVERLSWDQASLFSCLRLFSKSVQAVREIIADFFIFQSIHQVSLKENVNTLLDIPLSGVFLIQGQSSRCIPVNCLAGKCDTSSSLGPGMARSYAKARRMRHKSGSSDKPLTSCNQASFIGSACSAIGVNDGPGSDTPFTQSSSSAAKFTVTSPKLVLIDAGRINLDSMDRDFS
ncbi:unnamed protein product, partial [Protopolystoma xenopodis]